MPDPDSCEGKSMPATILPETSMFPQENAWHLQCQAYTAAAEFQKIEKNEVDDDPNCIGVRCIPSNLYDDYIVGVSLR